MLVLFVAVTCSLFEVAFAVVGMFAPPGFMLLPEKKPQSKGFFYDLYEDPFKW